ncbi:MaoC family dehydratase N-terminal domain-containing protein [Mycobacterium sp. ITM-2016-00317]|jgi:acyl dehydratase|uniref:MaoC family dehydratase N-terminal domain-containing protein n=1 Tax=Mycobacterium sp. ITM-2016-00317 TaxID=2099694 RepID=UPI000D42C3B1|nr:MaoC family dehydratase N-terminal domain-containing protein [Mycobacterium sp. ITM-2016-00317]WNG86801.1 MaoC family dehydratase N-terminal domain-containing protein [Mycobacterium sp. ITM-2016-00317]
MSAESLKGYQWPESTVDVERGRVAMFANAIGETDPVYFDVDAARAAGHPDLLAPPTFVFGLDLEHSDTLGVLAAHGVDLSAVLHGEQRFTYHRDVHAGDTLSLSAEFTDYYSKRNGALEFLVRRSQLTSGGDLVAEMESVSVIRNGAPS